MQIPYSYIENYSKALNTVSEQARKSLVAALSSIDYSMSIADIRNAVIAVMQPACGASTDMAARLAAEFYDGLRLRFGIDDGFHSEADSQRNPDATDGAVRAIVQDLVDDKPVSQFIAACANRIDYETRRAANECVTHNARRDPQKPRWARVPTGAETCKFCIMLASRGFVYHSDITASHAHAYCDCRIVPSWDKKNPSVQGYSPDAYYDEWVKSGFKPSSGGGGGDKRATKDLGKGGKFEDTGIRGMTEYLRSAETMDELYARADEVLEDIKTRWNANQRMIDAASAAAKERRNQLQRGD